MQTALDRLRQLIRIPTISRNDPATTDWASFREFVDVLPALYPALHGVVEREFVDEYSMLYRWKGRTDGPPTVFMAHYDVVSATDEGWTHPPFSAELVGEGDEQLLWGRGTLDDKGIVAAVLEAVEAGIAAGRTPECDIYLSFGHDEETLGTGAAAIAELLESRGVRPGLVLDEGGAVVEGIFPGVDGPIAVVGVSEKGIMSVTMTVDQNGGHAATPPRFSATARLARAILRLNGRPFRATMTPTVEQMLRTLGVHAHGLQRWLFTHIGLTRPLLRVLLGRLSDETSAMLRTTQAVTMLSGSQARNALAEQAVATVNVRIAVDSSVAEALQHVRRAVDDPLVRIEATQSYEPSPVSPADGRAWDLVSSTVDEVFPGTIVTPYVTNQATDSRRFTGISRFVYRFSPFEMSKEERGTLHAIDERMSVATFLKGVEFYSRLTEKL